MEKDIGKIKKNDQTDIIVRLDDFGGRKGLTIREFVNSERYTGFTKAGVRILASEFPRFKEMINSISSEDMKDEGSVVGGDKSSPQKTFSKSEKNKSHESSEEDLEDY